MAVQNSSRQKSWGCAGNLPLTLHAGRLCLQVDKQKAIENEKMYTA
jgi:hypothetical protein